MSKQQKKPTSKKEEENKSKFFKQDSEDEESEEETTTKNVKKPAPAQKKTAGGSKFFQGGSDSEEESEEDDPKPKGKQQAKPQQKPAAKKPVKKQESDSEEEDSEDEAPKKPAAKAPAKAPAKPAPKAAAKSKKEDSDDEGGNKLKASKWFAADSDEDEESDEDEAPKKPAAKAPAKPAAKAPAKPQPKKKAESESEEEDSEDEKPKKPAAKAPAKAAAKAPAKQGSKWFGSDSEEESDEEEKPKKPAAKAPAKAPAKPAAKAASGGKWFKGGDDSEDEESEEEKPQAKGKPAAKSWFKGGDSEDEDEDEEAEAPKEEEEEEDKRAAGSKASKWFSKDDDDEEDDDEDDLGSDLDLDSEDETPRPVKSSKAKKFEEMNALISKMQNVAKIGDWKQVQEDFNQLNKVLEKTMKLESIKETPKLYIKAIADLDEITNVASKNKKNTSAANQKILSSLRQRIKKNNTQYEAQIELYKKDPASFEKSEVEEEQKPVASKKKQQGEEEGGDDWEKVGGGKKKPTRVQRPPKPKKETIKEQKTVEVQYTESLIDERLEQIRKTRGKRQTNPLEQYNELRVMSSKVKAPGRVVQIYSYMMNVQIDIVPSTADFMPIENWKSIYLNLTHTLNLLDENASLSVLEEDMTEDVKLTESEVPIFGTFLTLFEKLDDEFIKSLQYIDPHTQDYVERLRHEVMILDVAERIFAFYSRRNEQFKLSRVALRLLDHLYYRKQEDHEKMLQRQREYIAGIYKEVREAAQKTQSVAVSEQPASPTEVITKDLNSFLQQLVSLVYTQGSTEDKVKALLMHVYHNAIHGKFYVARDMLLESKLQDDISKYDVSIQILYNRVIAQLGLCAFRNGLISEAHNCLADICTSSRLRELLAQAVTRNQQDKQKKLEQEKQERARLVPYHMHINLDMLEAVHLISAMLLEIPNMAQNTYNNLKKKTISKAYRKLIYFYDQAFLGPPETTRDHINLASRALMKGDWKGCYNVLMKLQMWNLMVDQNSAEMLKNKIKTEALRTYLLTFGKHYDTIGLKELSEMYDMKTNTVHNVVSKMMINEDFHASWDQPTQSIIVHRAEPTRLQFLALQLSERANQLLEYNERLFANFDSKSGMNFAPKHDGSAKKDGSRGRQNSQQSRSNTNKSKPQQQQQQQRYQRKQQK